MKNKTNPKTKLYVIVVVLIIASITFRFLNDFNFEQTSILFIGIPALITVLVIKNYDTPKTGQGIVFRVITLFLLMSSILLGEGTVCILFMAPIFYGVAALIVFIFDYSSGTDNKTYSLVIIPLLLIVAQPSEINKLGKINTIQNFKIIEKNCDFNTFKNTYNLKNNLPKFLKLGFPKPISITNTGINVGDTQNILFKSETKGVGLLSLKIQEKTNNKMVFEIVEDSSHINHWLTWRKIEVEIININPRKSKIVWTTSFRCDLGPSWYFEPLEKYAVGLMNSHLLNTYFN